MNKKWISLVAAVTFAMPAAYFVRPTVAAAAEEKKVEKSELHGHMEDIDDLLKKLRKTCRKAESNEESLKLITEIQELMVKSKALTPTKAAKIPEGERAKFVADYRKEMAGTIMQFCEMERAILDGDNGKAQEIYKAIVEREDKDHDVFMQKDEKKK
jgi:hypothetical protein